MAGQPTNPTANPETEAVALSGPEEPMRVGVVIADDDPLAGQKLAEYVASASDMDVLAVTDKGSEVLSVVQETRPDVVLMDLRMPDVDGIQATRGLRRAHPTVKVLAITAFGDHDALNAALRAGASGFLLKTAKPAEVTDAIRLVSSGHGVLPSDEVDRHWRDDDQQDVEEAPTLTQREAEVLAALGRGLSNREIADELDVAQSTVKLHVSTLMAKLGASSRIQALVRAHQMGLLAPGSNPPSAKSGIGTPGVDHP